MRTTIHSLPTETLYDILEHLPPPPTNPDASAAAASRAALLTAALAHPRFTPIAQTLLNKDVVLSEASAAKTWCESRVSGRGGTRRLAIEEDATALGDGWTGALVERCVERTGGGLRELRVGKLGGELEGEVLEMDELAGLTSLSLLTPITLSDDLPPSFPFSLTSLTIDSLSITPPLLSALLASSPALRHLSLVNIFSPPPSEHPARPPLARRLTGPLVPTTHHAWALEILAPLAPGLTSLTLCDSDPQPAALASPALAEYLGACTSLKRVSTHLLPQSGMELLSKGVEEVRLLPTEGVAGVFEVTREAFPALRRVAFVDWSEEAMAELEEVLVERGQPVGMKATCARLGVALEFEEMAYDTFGEPILDR